MSLSPESLERVYTAANELGEMLGLILLSFTGLIAWSFLLLYIFLWLTTERKPNVGRAESEKFYLDPATSEKHLFPSVNDDPTVYMSLVVPAYKEEERLPKMMDETMEYLEKRQKQQPSFTYEVIIVNDGSTDRTSEEALKYVTKYGADKVRLLEFTKNRGKGGAIRIGCLSARGERILMVDADGATEITDIENLEKAMDGIAKDYSVPAVVVGSRAHLQEEAVAERSFFRNILMYGFHLLVYVLCVRGIKDTQCGFKLFTRPAAARLFNALHIDRWAFDVELLYIAQQLKMPIDEVAVNWQEIEGSKLVPFWSWLQMGRDLLFIRMRYTFGLWKIPATKPKKE